MMALSSFMRWFLRWFKYHCYHIFVLEKPSVDGVDEWLANVSGNKCGQCGTVQVEELAAFVATKDAGHLQGARHGAGDVPGSRLVGASRQH